MGTVLSFRAEGREERKPRVAGSCEIVIFPGVRIERAEAVVDPGTATPTGRGKLDGTGGRRRSRKSS